ncbi:tyrosine-type recombinase/integrase [Halomonas sp.]|uniref:tyrosine-type recombinase/integrase n=1 Tax=Halomonas sp. TaxID=1486246 RepID=UPI0035619706
MLTHLAPPYLLVIRLLYGSGLRIGEATRLRIKDVDLQRRSLIVRDGKGAKDRVTVVADSCIAPVRNQIERSLALCSDDRQRQRQRGGVLLPYALAGQHQQLERRRHGRVQHRAVDRLPQLA